MGILFLRSQWTCRIQTIFKLLRNFEISFRKQMANLHSIPHQHNSILLMKTSFSFSPPNSMRHIHEKVNRSMKLSIKTLPPLSSPPPTNSSQIQFFKGFPHTNSSHGGTKSESYIISTRSFRNLKKVEKEIEHTKRITTSEVEIHNNYNDYNNNNESCNAKTKKEKEKAVLPSSSSMVKGHSRVQYINCNASEFYLKPPIDCRSNSKSNSNSNSNLYSHSNSNSNSNSNPNSHSNSNPNLNSNLYSYSHSHSHSYSYSNSHSNSNSNPNSNLNSNSYSNPNSNSISISNWNGFSPERSVLFKKRASSVLNDSQIYPFGSNHLFESNKKRSVVFNSSKRRGLNAQEEDWKAKQTESNGIKSNQNESNQKESNEIKSNGKESNRNESNQNESNGKESNQNNSNKVGLSEDKSMETRSNKKTTASSSLSFTLSSSSSSLVDNKKCLSEILPHDSSAFPTHCDLSESEQGSKSDDVSEQSPTDTSDSVEIKNMKIEEMEDGEMLIVRFEDAMDYAHSEADGEDRTVPDEILIPRKEKGILVIDDSNSAERMVEILMNDFKDGEFACDTEVCGINVQNQTALAHGNLVCFSLYCGPNVNLYHGFSRLWVDTFNKPEVLLRFKPFFEDKTIKKIWHNYSFNRHVFAHAGIHVAGFHSDTMHLARLWDSSRVGGQITYSLESLTVDKDVMNGTNTLWEDERRWPAKISLKSIFSKPKINKNGKVGKIMEVAPIDEIQTNAKTRQKWIHYSAYDSVITWILSYSLQKKLEAMTWHCDVTREKGTMFDFYLIYWRPFAEVLASMEEYGMKVDRKYLAELEIQAGIELQHAEHAFREWASEKCGDAKWMNVNSNTQIRQLLFAGTSNKKDPDLTIPSERTFTVTIDLPPEEEERDGKETAKKVKKKKKEITLKGLGVHIPTDSYTSTGWPCANENLMRGLAGKITFDNSANGDEDMSREEEEELEEGKEGELDVSVDGREGEGEGEGRISENEEGTSQKKEVLNKKIKRRKYEKDVSKYGIAYHVFGEGLEGKKACYAFAALCEMNSINILLSNFIRPLQGTDVVGSDDRVHCSININTETGRLSARRPSLQNQPSGAKDRYKIRKAFVADEGNSLVVADYGQLELRILAHLSNCTSMLEAFKLGGDFHSRTALNMYAHVREAVDRGEVVLEWKSSPGREKPPVPLLKDKFKTERQKAKMLNFSIAYGKTSMGLSKDWKVTPEEARETLDLWYRDRPEVKVWQEKRIAEANETKRVHTLLGRTRHFPQIVNNNHINNHNNNFKYNHNHNHKSSIVEMKKRLLQSHLERAAINTPVQGSAADITMLAMLEITQNQWLKEIGWKLLLQVHDEVILEGPVETALEAQKIVEQCMQNPFKGKNLLNVDLVVDAKTAKSWYEAK